MMHGRSTRRLDWAAGSSAGSWGGCGTVRGGWTVLRDCPRGVDSWGGSGLCSGTVRGLFLFRRDNRGGFFRAAGLSAVDLDFSHGGQLDLDVLRRLDHHTARF